MSLRPLAAGFIAPCLPTKTDKLPSGGQWLHEIKHDGFRIIARKNGERVRLYSRPGNDFTRRFPLIVDALSRLRSRSCIIDGEAVACNDNGMASFDLIRHHRHNDRVFVCAPRLADCPPRRRRSSQLPVGIQVEPRCRADPVRCARARCRTAGLGGVAPEAGTVTTSYIR